MTDRELLERYAHGDAEAFEELVRRHLDMVYVAARRRAGDSADDIVQAVFILLARKAAKLSRHTSVAGWLCQAVRYCCANLSRIENRRRRHERKAAMIPTAPEQNTQDLLHLLDIAIQTLGQKERDVVLLRYLESKTIDETAHQLGISLSAAAKRAQRGLEKLRQFFATHGYATSITAVTTLMVAEAAKSAPPAAAALALSAIAKAPALSPTVTSLIKGTQTMLNLAKIKSAAALVAVGLLVPAITAAVTLRVISFPASPPSSAHPMNLSTSTAPSTQPSPPAAPLDNAPLGQLAADDHQITGDESLDISLINPRAGIAVTHYPIAPDGTIHLPGINPIPVVQRNARQVATAIVLAYENANPRFNLVYVDIHLPAGAPALGQPDSGPPNHKIGPGDLLAISILDFMGEGTGKFNRTQRVAADGSCDLPFLPPIKASGQTADDLQTTIQDSYNSARLLRNAPITVKVLEIGKH